MNEDTAYAESRLKLVRLITLAMLVFAPLLYLFMGYEMNYPGIGAIAGNELMLYILLVWSALTPFIWPVLERAYVAKYQAGELGDKTPAHLFFQMSLIRISFVVSIYVFGQVALILTGEFTNMLYFYPIGIAWSFVHWPRRKHYEQLLKKLEQA